MDIEKKEELIFGEDYFPRYAEVRISANGTGSFLNCIAGDNVDLSRPYELTKELRLVLLNQRGNCRIDLGNHEYLSSITLYPNANEGYPIRVARLELMEA